MESWTTADEDAAKERYLLSLERKRSRADDDDDDEDGDDDAKRPRTSNLDPKEEFKVYSLDLLANAFPHMFPSVQLEPLGKGRQGAILVHPDPEQGTPLVRSTIQFQKAAQIFQPLHHQLANSIITEAGLQMPLNNCMVLLLDQDCPETELESMQAQDLAFFDESCICLFSCYQDPTRVTRKLVVQAKTEAQETHEIVLQPNSVVVWSLEANRNFRHQIVQMEDDSTNNPWMGFFFRTSSTPIQYRDNRAFFANGTPLILLKGERACSTTHRLRELENEGSIFLYPSCMMSTISPGDLLPPIDTAATTTSANEN